MRTINQLINKDRKVYVLLNGRAIGYRFLSDAEREGFLFGDGVKPTEREPGDIMALLSESEICYVGWAGHMCYHNDPQVIRVDYEKYIDGNDDYLISLSEVKAK